jgi:hypothetical protein
MIEKMLDKYFTKKLKKHISTYMLHWYIDTRFIEKADHIILQIKKPHYKDETYTTIYDFYEFNSIYYLLDIKNVRKDLEESVNKYLEEYKGE